MLNKLFNQVCLAKWPILSVFLLATALVGCNGGSATSSGDEQVVIDHGTNGALIIEKTAVVPVLNGKSTFAGVYVYNNGDTPLNNIHYEAKSTSSDAGITLTTSTVCANLASHASCLLSFYTPAVDKFRSGSSVLVANYAGKSSHQLINYEYIDVNKTEGVQFSGNASLFGTNDYATVYAFAGNAKSYHQVGFASDDQSVAVNNGLINGRIDIAADQVIPLELKSSYAITTTLAHILILSDTEDALKTVNKATKFDSKNNLKSGSLPVTLAVNLVPQQQANLIISNPAIMNFKTESVQTITVMNNGNLAATNVVIPASSDSAKINISANNCNSTINPGASCTFSANLADLYSNGSDIINILYHNGIQDTSISQQITYYYRNDLPMVSIIPDNNYVFTEQIGDSNSFHVYVTNSGNVALSNISKVIRSTLVNYPVVDTAAGGSSCNVKTSLGAAGGNCLSTWLINASNGVLTDSGSIYMKMSGSFNGQSYSFVSKPVTATVEINNNMLNVVGITPANNSTDIARSTPIQISFNKATKVNTVNTATVKLYRNSDSLPVNLALQGYSSDGQTFTFVVTDNNGLLEAATSYNLVINPSQIQASNGSALNSAVTSQNISTFTTGSTVGPQVSSYQPANGTYTSTNSQLFVTFSKDMEQSTLNSSNVILYNSTDAVNVATSLNYDNSNSHYMLSITPSTTLIAGKTYQLFLNESQISDTNSNLLGSGSRQIMQFYVDNTVGPIVVSSSPANGAAGVSVSTNSMTLTFSQTMNDATISTTSVQLYNQNNQAVTLAAPAISNNKTVFTFPINSALESGMGYYLNLTTGASGIKDANSNELVLTTSPTNGGLNVSASNATNPAIQFMTTQNVTGFLVTGNYSNASVFNVDGYSSTSIRFANYNSAYNGAAIANDGSYLLAGFTSNTNPQLMRSTDQGTSWGAAYTTTSLGIYHGFSSRILCFTDNSGVCLVGSGDIRSDTTRNHGIDKTTNNGAYWYTSTISEDLSIASLKYQILGGSCLTNGTCVFAGKGTTTDTKGIYLVSTNRGDSWDSHVISTATKGFNDVDCNLDHNSCVMVGSSGKIYYLIGLTHLSIVGGEAAWQEVSSTVAKNLFGVRCNDGGVCVAVGESNTILKSSDFGGTWAAASGTKPTGTAQQYNSIEYDSVNNRFVVVGNSGWLIYSTDGNNWSSSSEISETASIMSISCNNGQCIAGTKVTGGSKASYTASPIWVYNGSSWSNKAAIANGVYENTYSAYCAKAGTFCLQGTENGYVNIGTISNGVINWAFKATGTSSIINGITCNSVNCIIIYATGKPRYISVANVTNAANSWTETSTSYSLKAVTCIANSTTCLAVGPANNIYRSTGSGQSWSAVASATTKTLNAISCGINESAGTCIAVGADGVQTKTTNSGTSWTSSIPFSSSAAMKAISCNINMCVAGGELGGLSVLYRSINGGISWATTSGVSGFGGSILAVSCADGLCLASGEQKDVTNRYSNIVSYDNGLTWQDLNIYYTDANMRAITPYY